MRLAGFEMGWGRPVPESARLLVDRYRIEHAAAAVSQYLAMSPRPQGIFAASDDLAIGFILGGIALGIRPGLDYQIIGFDGQRMGQELTDGPLTTVEVPAQAMGAKGAQFLAERILDPDQSVRRMSLGCTLREGATVRDR